jgi:hypothetical protein
MAKLSSTKTFGARAFSQLATPSTQFQPFIQRPELKLRLPFLTGHYFSYPQSELNKIAGWELGH